jgi:large subunit ribosomal protein L30e
MADNVALKKLLKEAMKGGKSPLGAKETLSGLKGSRALLISTSVPPIMGAKLREEAEKQKVPIVEAGITSAELGRLVGKPYNVSAIALKSVSESDVKQLVK